MGKSISILDKDYLHWIEQLASRYRQSQIKSSIRVNQEMLRFYWELGRDMVEMRIEERWGEKVIQKLSIDLKNHIPNAHCFSRTNLYYIKKFYQLYSQEIVNVQQLVGQNEKTKYEVTQQLAGQETNKTHISSEVFSIPWGHHIKIIDSCSHNLNKALFFVHQSIENGWSRAVLQNFIDTDLYERQSKAVTNFNNTLPEVSSDLAQELTKDPYNFAFAGITKRYNERQLKDALLNNITDFLIELGTGFAYVGKEFSLMIGETEKFIDLLFYNLKLRCYVVVEVKVDKFDSKDIGQLATYVTAANHLLKNTEYDNPTIGLLVCRSKDNTLARYALESTNQPIGISEYELEKFYPTKVEGMIPTIKEIEAKLKSKL